MAIIAHTNAVQTTLPPGMAVQLTDIVRHAPMPLPVKEMILDQVFGHHEDLYHDDLHQPAKKRQVRTPMAERVAQARADGAFEFLRTERDCTDVWRYEIAGEGRYEIRTRDERFLSCTCRNFQVEHWHDPDYTCKHGHLWLEMQNMPTENEYAALVEEAAQAEAKATRLWLAWRHGRATAEACSAAGRCAEAARDAAHQALPDVAGTVGEQWAREGRAA